MSNTKLIKTDRLILRRFTKNDIEAFFYIINDEHVNAFLPLLPFTTINEAELFLQEKYLSTYKKSLGFRYAVCLLTNNVPIGFVNVSDDDSYDLGYGLAKDYWHKGIITEACKSILKNVKNANIPYITATHDVNNPRSGNVMKNIGMSYRYSFEEQWEPKNKLVLFRMYQLTLNEQNYNTYMKYWNNSLNHFIEKDI